jgi:hypothetical protein
MYIYVLYDVHVSRSRKGRWTIASARQNLPTLVTLAAREPQEIYRRDELVARVVSPDLAPPVKRTAAELIAEIRRACAEENYTLEIPPRTSRPDTFARPASRRRCKPGKSQR